MTKIIVHAKCANIGYRGEYIAKGSTTKIYRKPWILINELPRRGTGESRGYD